MKIFMMQPERFNVHNALHCTLSKLSFILMSRRKHTISTFLSTMTHLWNVINDLFPIPGTVKFYFLNLIIVGFR